MTSYRAGFTFTFTNGIIIIIIWRRVDCAAGSAFKWNINKCTVLPKLLHFTKRLVFDVFSAKEKTRILFFYFIVWNNNNIQTEEQPHNSMKLAGWRKHFLE
jgi:hypothetical protein